jgi:hypothetical protein
MTLTGENQGTQNENLAQCHCPPQIPQNNINLPKDQSTYALKVKLFLSLIKHYAIIAYGEVDIYVFIYPRIINLGTRWGSVISYTLRPRQRALDTH